MKYNPDKHHRRSIRLKGYNYSIPGAYYITVCSYSRECLFGEIHNREMVLNQYGKIVLIKWNNISRHFKNTELDKFVIMLNHIHGIIILQNDCRGTACRALEKKSISENKIEGKARLAPTGHKSIGNPVSGSIPIIIGAFKSSVTKQINKLRNKPGEFVWQRNYYEHIIRNEKELNKIRAYIYNNPSNWEKDEKNPENL